MPALKRVKRLSPGPADARLAMLEAAMDDVEGVEVSRLGAPLVNEVVVPLAAKDLWNNSKPDGDAQFLGGVTDPELARLFKAIYKILENSSTADVTLRVQVWGFILSKPL